jgi:hypothetical protein
MQLCIGRCLQIALQQQMFAAARAASLTTADNAAMMAAAYQAQLQQQQHHASVSGQTHVVIGSGTAPLATPIQGAAAQPTSGTGGPT